MRHSLLHNIVERIIGILKRRFAILHSAPQYSVPVHVKLVLALVGLHNFIVRNSSNRDIVQGLDFPIGSDTARGSSQGTSSIVP